MIIDWIARYRTVIISIVVLVVVGIVGYTIYSTSTRAGKTKVDIVVVPKDAAIKVNGTPMTPPLYLTPGDYTISASKEGFATLEKSKTITNKETTLTMPLNAESDEANKWAEQNQEQYLTLEGIAGRLATKEGEEVSTKNPVIQVLPFSNYIYTIGYKNDPSDPSGESIIVTIDTIEGYRNAAVQKIRELGFDPSQLKIEFKDYESPFENE